MGYSTRAAQTMAQRGGPQAWLAWQLRPGQVPDPALDTRLQAYPWLSDTAAQIQAQLGSSTSNARREFQSATLLRAVYSERQLLERTAMFWTDHFSMNARDSRVAILKIVDDREVTRRFAFGRFRDLLGASAHSPSMLEYLDNYNNRRGRPQENYARELMELHTIDAGNFSEDDVREVSRCFTGWTYDRDRSSSTYGEFLFNASRHDDDAKMVLGVPIPAGGGMQDGETVLDILASHPATATFVSRKLLRWFLTYTPSPSLVASVAQVFTRTNGDIAVVIREILSQQFAHRASRKLKRPFHLAVSMLRATGADITNARNATNSLSNLGQALFEWPAPNGYPDVEAAWSFDLLPRWTLGSRVMNNGAQSFTSLSTADLLALLQGTPQANWGQAIFAILTGGFATEIDVLAVQSLVDTLQVSDPVKAGQAFEIAVNTPSYQSY